MDPNALVGHEKRRPDQTVSLIRVLANPELFHGKKVMVFGVYRAGFEESAVYPDREMSATAANGIWVGLLGPSDAMQRFPKGEWASIEGIFDAHSHGHLDAYPGTITSPKISFTGSWVERESDKKKRANQSLEPTAPSGRGSP